MSDFKNESNLISMMVNETFDSTQKAYVHYLEKKSAYELTIQNFSVEVPENWSGFIKLDNGEYELPSEFLKVFSTVTINSLSSVRFHPQDLTLEVLFSDNLDLSIAA